MHATSDKELQTCVKLPQNLPDDTLFRTMLFHEDLDDRMYSRQVARLVVIQRQDQKYFPDRESGNLYDYDKLHSKNKLVLVFSKKCLVECETVLRFKVEWIHVGVSELGIAQTITVVCANSAVSVALGCRKTFQVI